MSPYITFQDTDKDGNLQNYILQREFPHYICVIADKKSEISIAQQPILGYRLWIILSGTLRGNMIPSYTDTLKEIEAVVLDMSNWFYKNRVVANPKKYKNYVSSPV